MNGNSERLKVGCNYEFELYPEDIFRAYKMTYSSDYQCSHIITSVEEYSLIDFDFSPDEDGNYSELPETVHLALMDRLTFLMNTFAIYQFSYSLRENVKIGEWYAIIHDKDFQLYEPTKKNFGKRVKPHIHVLVMFDKPTLFDDFNSVNFGCQHYFESPDEYITMRKRTYPKFISSSKFCHLANVGKLNEFKKYLIHQVHKKNGGNLYPASDVFGSRDFLTDEVWKPIKKNSLFSIYIDRIENNEFNSLGSLFKALHSDECVLNAYDRRELKEVYFDTMKRNGEKYNDTQSQM